MKRWIALAIGLAGTALAIAGAAVALMPAPAPGHQPFHIGCRDHNHGPKWHAGHGKAALTPISRFAKPESDGEPVGRD